MELSAYIKDDLQRRIQSGAGPAWKVTLPEIAEYYTAVFDYAAPETHVVATMAGQHREILEALLAKHWAQARRALSHHIWEQRPILMGLFDTAPSEARRLIITPCVPPKTTLLLAFTFEANTTN